MHARTHAQRLAEYYSETVTDRAYVFGMSAGAETVYICTHMLRVYKSVALRRYMYMRT